jgi:hypothetical protein
MQGKVATDDVLAAYPAEVRPAAPNETTPD